MNNKHLSWNNEINNNFIIASRAYFLQSPTCTRVNNLVHIAVWFNTNIHIVVWLTPIVHTFMWPTPKGFTRVNNLVQITMWLTPKEYWGVIMFCLWENFSQRVCHTLANCSHFLCQQCSARSYSSRGLLGTLCFFYLSTHIKFPV